MKECVQRTPEGGKRQKHNEWLCRKQNYHAHPTPKHGQTRLIRLTQPTATPPSMPAGEARSISDNPHKSQIKSKNSSRTLKNCANLSAPKDVTRQWKGRINSSRT